MNNAGHQHQGSQGGDISRFSDSETEIDELRNRDRSPPPQASKSPSDILTSFSRGFAKLKRQPSQLVLKHNRDQSAPTPEPTTSSAPVVPTIRSPAPPNHQHARNLSYQNSLLKPLPEPPPPSPGTPQAIQEHPSQHPQTSQHQHQSSLATILDTNAYSEPSNSTSESETESRTNTMDSSTSEAHNYMAGISNRSQTSLSGARNDGGDDGQRDNIAFKSIGPNSAGPSPNVNQPRTPAIAGSGSSPASGLLCNVHRTTGREPHPLVGATTTIVGDKLYVFGGRILSRSRPTPLTADLYELDLIRRHWTKLETNGEIPPPRYFHSMCALGDTKMVCYGGMSPAQSTTGVDGPGDVTVMSDIYVYDVPTRKWTFIPTSDAPQGRYAHCACILPSSAAFSSYKAPLSALQHNPSTGANEGRIGINIDGTGGAEMMVVGGQDGANHYIEQISVFNLRSLKWTYTQPLGKSCGAYRSVVAPLPPAVTAKIGKANTNGMQRSEGSISQEAREPGSSMLIYSNYNFLDVKLELQIRSSDGVLSEKPMPNAYSPPGLRFPNGGIIDTYFVVSGTYLTSSKQEYALWALDLRTLQWMRIDAGGNVFKDGSWNRGVLWNRRNAFVILGNRKRSLVDDYNHRRINFTNVCVVELEAFGFYDNPRKVNPMSGFISASSPYTGPGLSLPRKAGATAGGRFHSRASEELGEKALAIRELADMDILCIGGERIPTNSRIIARRWGPYFVQLLREGTAMQDGSDSITLRSSGAPGGVRSSILTITPATRTMSRDTDMSTATTLAGSSSGGSISGPSGSFSGPSGSFSGPSGLSASGALNQEATNPNAAPTPLSLPPNSRPRCLYLPHTYLTVQALLHYLYNSSLPVPSSPLCTPQILCSLLQIARPYRIDGLLEAIVDRLHTLFENRNAAAIFNATAMAAGGGRGIDGTLNPNYFVVSGLESSGIDQSSGQAQNGATGEEAYGNGGAGNRGTALRINTSVPGRTGRPPSDELSATTSTSGSEWSASEVGDSDRGGRDGAVWSGELSSVIGLQKRGLRGLMEGRKLRERTGTATTSSMLNPSARVGLGIAGSGN
ncbi:Protein ral2 [Cytospora mali]|uniref:Protein ral2 n=1 Tax=Cytospora mali TaxID=578113 RepID=A0A194VJV5_CYTMA|nr:Protein ral2 [Valsa mali]